VPYSIIEIFIIFIIFVIILLIIFLAIDEKLASTPKRVERVPRKRRKLNRVIDERFGETPFEIIRREKLEPYRYKYFMRNSKLRIAVPYYDWELQPVSNHEALSGTGIAIFRYVGDATASSVDTWKKRFLTLKSDHERLKKKSIQQEAYEDKKFRDVVEEAVKLVRTGKEARQQATGSR